MEATQSGNLLSIQDLWDQAHDIDAVRDGDGRSLLHIACSKGQVDVVQFLLERTAILVNTQDDSGFTPLFEASLNGHLEIVDLLMQHGAKVDVADDTGSTPLQMAVLSEAHENRVGTFEAWGESIPLGS